MSKSRKRKIYGLAGGAGALATADPADIVQTLPRRAIKGLRASTQARINVQFFPGGPWDLAAEPFEIHRYVRELFVDQVPVQQSEQYQDMVARLSDPSLGGSVWGCRTLAEVDQYFDRLFAMFEDMRANGYRPHTALGASPDDEVKVRVGRDGRLIKASGGNHRVSFAKLLEVDRIPVLVCGVHREYLRRRAGTTGAWKASTVADVLASAGLAGCRPSDLERVAGRLEPGNLVRSAAALSRRSGLSEGSGAIVSLYDDVHLYLQPIFAQGVVPL